jgi:2-dehydropantoate 2-reductase
MISKMKIAVLGMGGVGGYYGGKLAAHYHRSDHYEIIFIARGESERVIRERGIHLVTATSNDYIKPDLVSYDPLEIGNVDLLICCVKGYDLEDSLLHIRACIHPETIILPLLNGVNITEKITAIIPHARVWKGCVYIVTRQVSPGEIHETSAFKILYFGSENENTEPISAVESIFSAAGIEARGETNINLSIWNKFIFLCPIATMTTRFNQPIGAILENQQTKELLAQLISEISVVAKAQGINLGGKVVEETVNRIKKLPYENYSSMHYDFYRRKKTEIDSLTGYIVEAGKEFSLAVPLHERMLAELNELSTKLKG